MGWLLLFLNAAAAVAVVLASRDYPVLVRGRMKRTAETVEFSRKELDALIERAHLDEADSEPASPSPEANARCTVLEAHEVQVLLAGGDPAGTQVAAAWRRVDPPG